MKNLLIIATISLLLSSCMVTKTDVGQYRMQEGESVTYSKAKQIWLLGIPLGRTKVATPESGDCQIITKYNVSDVLVKTLTGGTVKTYTIKVKVKKVAIESKQEITKQHQKDEKESK